MFLNTSKFSTTGLEDTPPWTIGLLLSSKKGWVKLNWVPTFSGKDQMQVIHLGLKTEAVSKGHISIDIIST